MTIKKHLNFFKILLCVFSPILGLSQKVDTLIVIPFGNNVPESKMLTHGIKSSSSGLNHINYIDKYGEVHFLTSSYLSDYQSIQIKDKITKIATGDIHSVVLYPDSTINQFFVHSSLTMFYPNKLKKVVDISSGPKLSAALTSKGILYTWGRLGQVKKLNIPIKIYGVKHISVGKDHIAIINRKDKIYVWGKPNFGLNQIPTVKGKPVKIVSGDYHSLALDDEGIVYAWGANFVGQTDVPVFSEKIVEVYAKNNYSAALTQSGKLYVWGNNFNTTYKVDNALVKNISLGSNFLALIISKEKKNNVKLIIEKPSSDQLKTVIPDSLKSLIDVYSNEDFLAKYLVNNFAIKHNNNNQIIIEDLDVNIKEDNFSSSIEFEGSNNQIKIINDKLKINANNSHQKIIIKGDNKNVVIHNSGELTMQNDTSTIVIDLNVLDNNTAYPTEYEDISDFPIDENATFDITTTSLSYINEFPIANGDYLLDGEFVGKTNDLQQIYNEAQFWTSPFEKAQALLFCGYINEAIKVLENSDSFESKCKLALYEIYYYGLFDVPINLTLAKKYLAEYQAEDK